MECGRMSILCVQEFDRGEAGAPGQGGPSGSGKQQPGKAPDAADYSNETELIEDASEPAAAPVAAATAAAPAPALDSAALLA